MLVFTIRTFAVALLAASFLLMATSSAVAQQTRSYVSPKEASLASEVSIAINPTNLDNIVAGSLIRGYETGSDASYYTMDGGKTWKTVMMPNPEKRTQGDDVVLFRRDGVCVHAFISFKGLWEEHPKEAASGILISSSEDGGKTWGEQVVVADHINTKSPMEDKPWLAFDKSAASPHRNNLYCSWTRFDHYGSEDPQDTTQIMFSRSLDGGKSFQPVIRISDQGGDCVDDDDTVEGAVPCVDPEGNVYVVWAGPRGLEMDKSTDGGKTFGKDKVLTEMPGGWSSDVEGIGRHNGMPVTGVDNSTGEHKGTIYVNWIDERNGDKDVFVMASRDKGETWSEPVKVNDDDSKRDQFFTWMAVDPMDGSVNIAFYDRRDTEGVGTKLTLCRSIDGGKSFKNIPVDVPEFKTRKNVFFGDYIGIDALGGRVAIAYMEFPKERPLGVSSSVFDFKPGTLELAKEEERGNAGRPDQISVQHILIGFKGSVGDKPITRSKEEAEKFAKEILEEAQSGADFDELVKKHTDDSAPGIYKMSNHFSQGDIKAKPPIFPRTLMVPAFGNVGFPLEVGGIGMADYDPDTSKYGWHIIKRVK